MFRNFITAFKRAYNDVYKDKITAKKYLQYFYEECILQKSYVDLLKRLIKDLDACAASSGVPVPIYVGVFLSLSYFLKSNMKEAGDGENDGGYLNALEDIYRKMVIHYNYAKTCYLCHNYKECIVEIKNGVQEYNEGWKKLDLARPEISTENWDKHI